MLVPQNESSALSVNGHAFRWMLHDSGHVIVQHGSGHGCCLVVETTADLESSDVEKLIEMALDADWEPHQDGPNHWFRFDTTNSAPALSTIESRDEQL